MCVFGVSELQFELMVPLGLPKCIVGCRTMTTIRKSFFFFFKKKCRALWLKKNSGLILASLFINTLLYLVLICLIFEFKLKLNFIHLLNKININIIFPKFELDLFINNCTFFLEKKQLYCYVSWTRACCQEACSNFLSSNYHKLLTKR